MDRDKILAEVQRVLISVFDFKKEEVTPDTNLYTDLDLDSLDAIDMAAELSAQTDMLFSNDDLRKIRTVSDIVDLIAAKQSEKE
jgi:acyl carrier protein